MDAGVRARFLVVAAALLFSTGGAAIKSCSFTGLQVASLRSGVAAIFLLLALPAARRGWNWRVLPVGLAYASTMILFVVGNKLTTSAHTIFLQSTAPLYILLLSPWLLRERIHRSDTLKMLLVAAGLLTLFLVTQMPLDTASDPRRGNVLAVLSGVAWALTIMGLRWLGKRTGPGPDATLAAVVVGNVIACAACLPWSLPVVDNTAVNWTTIAFLGVVQIGLAYICLTSAVAHVPAFQVSLLLLIEPVMNPVWSWLVHGENPGPWVFLGGLLILSASMLKTPPAES